MNAPPDDPNATNATPEALLLLVYDELRRLAARKLAQENAGQTLQATALVHEAWLRLGPSGERQWMDRDHFFRAAALAMRRILVDRARHKLALKSGGDVRRISLDVFDLPGVSIEDSVLLIDEALALFEAEDPEAARVVQLKFFAGLGNQEAAEALGMSLRSLNRIWAYARIRLFQIIQKIEGDMETSPRSPVP